MKLQYTLTLWYSILLVCCVGCAEYIQTVQLTPHKAYSLPLSPTQHWIPSRVQYKKFDNGKEIVWMWDFSNYEIVVYDYPSGEMNKTIPVQLFGNKRDFCLSIDWHGYDSIFVMTNAAYHSNYWHDSTIFLIDTLGSVQEVYDVSTAPVWTSSRPEIDKDSVYYFWGSDATQMSFQDGKLTLFLVRYGMGVGDSLFQHPPTKVAGFLDISGQTDTFMFANAHVPSKPSVYFPRPASKALGFMNSDSTLLYRFQHLPTIFEENIKTGDLRQYELPSYVFDSLPPLSSAEYLPHHQRPRMKYFYGSLAYDPYKELYINILGYPFSNPENAPKNFQAKRGIILFDKSFQKVAEGLLPESYVGNFFITPKGLGLLDISRSSVAEDSIYFTIFDYQYNQQSREDYKKMAVLEAPTIKPGGWTAYLQDSYAIQDQKSIVLFAPADLGCDGCLDYMISYFKEESNRSKQDGLYCIIAAENERILNKKLYSHNLTKDHPNLLLDSSGEFLSYVGRDFRQGLLLFVEQGEVTAQTSIIPSQLSGLPGLIDNYLKE
ncbi:MAG: hypothetical protein AAF587_15775 [Bacteroidota bacterium]